LEGVLDSLNDITRTTCIGAEKIGVKQVEISKSSSKPALPRNKEELLQELERIDRILASLDHMNVNAHLLVDKIEGLIKCMPIQQEMTDARKLLTHITDEVKAINADLEVLQSPKDSTSAKKSISLTNQKEESSISDNHDAKYQHVCKELGKIEKQLELLDAMRAATGVDLERSDALLSLMSSIKANKSSSVDKIATPGPTPTNKYASSCALETTFSAESKSHPAPDSAFVSLVPEHQTEDQQKCIDLILQAAKVCEERIDKLEQMYSDVKLLTSRAKVLHDGILSVEEAMQASTKKQCVESTEVVQPIISAAQKRQLSPQETENKASHAEISQQIIQPSETTVSAMTAKALEQSSDIRDIMPSITAIEARVGQLDRMYEDVKHLRGQAEVLSDDINIAKTAKLAASISKVVKDDVPSIVSKDVVSMASTKPIQAKPSENEPDAKSDVLISKEAKPDGSKTVLKNTITLVSTKPIQTEPSPTLPDENGQMLGLKQNLSMIENQLSLLLSIDRATAIDVDRSEILLRKVSNLEKHVRGSSQVQVCDVSPTSLVPKSTPMDIHSYLAAIEKRLTAIEDLKKQKGMQCEQIDASIIKIRKLENHLKGSKKQQPAPVQAPLSTEESNINDLIKMITKIDGKVSILEKLYQEVQVLQSQAQVLGDQIHDYETKKLKASRESNLKSSDEGNKMPHNSEKLDGAMENIEILEKEISDLLKESEMGNLGKKLESMEEWEVVDKQSIQDQMQHTKPQCMTSGELAKMRVGKTLQRTYSEETTELMAKVDGMKESVEEQKALRMLERENSLEYLDYGGTGGPGEQEAALLLERVDQGFTQIITDQSESHLMTSLKKELTPESLDSDTTLAEHEREKLHQQQLIRQIQEMQDPAVLQEQMEAYELLASLDKEHRIEREKQAQLQDQSQAMINIELKRKNVIERQEDIKQQMEHLTKTLNLQRELATAELMDIQDDPMEDKQWVQEHQQVMEHELMKRISLMQQDSKLLDVELENIARQEQKLLQKSPEPEKEPIEALSEHELMKQTSLMQQDSKLMHAELENIAHQEPKLLQKSPEPEKKPIEVLLDQTVVLRKKRSVETGSKEQGWAEETDIDQQLRLLSFEFQRMMWEVEKQTFMESGQVDVDKGIEAESEKETAFEDILPKGGRIDPAIAFEPIAAMRRTITNVRKADHSNKLVLQLNFLSNCLDTVESQIRHLKMTRISTKETAVEEGVCKECKQELPKEKS